MGTLQSGQQCRLGNGRTTGHQKRSAVPKKHACSNLCQPGERNASSKAAGTCHAHKLIAIANQQITGCVNASPNRRSAGQERNGPTPSCANFLGSPRNSGSRGAPSRISGGATVSSRRCCTICADNSRPENVSSGDAMATQSATSPPRKAISLQVENRVGVMRSEEHTSELQSRFGISYAVFCL